MTKRNFKALQALQKKNEVLRWELDNLIGFDSPLFSPIWVKINELVENELKQEECCKE